MAVSSGNPSLLFIKNIALKKYIFQINLKSATFFLVELMQIDRLKKSFDTTTTNYTVILGEAAKKVLFFRGQSTKAFSPPPLRLSGQPLNLPPS